ncbi:MAG: hypothetical protein ACTSYL_11430 [Candidatus Thorarchaeota archaeon]
MNEKETHGEIYFSRYASIYTKPTGIPYSSSSLATSIVLQVPVCQDHMGKRTFGTALTGVIGFFLFFYPLLFSLLCISRDLRYGGNLVLDTLVFLTFAGITSALLLYGFFPRSIERAIFIERANRGEDLIFLRISNEEYLEQFMELNQMHAKIITEEEFEEEGHEDSTTAASPLKM